MNFYVNLLAFFLTCFILFQCKHNLLLLQAAKKLEKFISNTELNIRKERRENEISTLDWKWTNLRINMLILGNEFFFLLAYLMFFGWELLNVIVVGVWETLDATDVTDNWHFIKHEAKGNSRENSFCLVVFLVFSFWFLKILIWSEFYENFLYSFVGFSDLEIFLTTNLLLNLCWGEFKTSLIIYGRNVNAIDALKLVLNPIKHWFGRLQLNFAKKKNRCVVDPAYFEIYKEPIFFQFLYYGSLIIFPLKRRTIQNEWRKKIVSHHK